MREERRGRDGRGGRVWRCRTREAEEEREAGTGREGWIGRGWASEMEGTGEEGGDRCEREGAE